MNHFSKKNSLYFGISIVFVTLMMFSSACKDEEKPKGPTHADSLGGPYNQGIFIVNEGGFGNNNASVSFYSAEYDPFFDMDADSVYNNIYEDANQNSLGDVAQSITLFDSLAFIVVNNSNKIEVVKYASFKSRNVITGVKSPRFMVINNGKGYVSCWGDNSVKVVDLNTYSVVNSIPTGAGPEKMLVKNNKLYVANSGGWGTDSTISVIDLSTEKVLKNISVKYAPMDMVVDKNGYIWALCTGKIVYDPVNYSILEETPSRVYKINPADETVLYSVTLFSKQHPNSIEIDTLGENMYIGGGYGFEGVYKLVVNLSDYSITKILDESVYGINLDAKTNVLFVTSAPSFTEAGYLKRYTTDGTLLGTYTVGIGPNGSAFKHAK